VILENSVDVPFRHSDPQETRAEIEAWMEELGWRKGVDYVYFGYAGHPKLRRPTHLGWLINTKSQAMMVKLTWGGKR
jgi:hypothetical protein